MFRRDVVRPLSITDNKAINTSFNTDMSLLTAMLHLQSACNVI